MNTIYKYPFEVTGVQGISMPFGAEILTVQTQRDQICLWALVDAEAPMVEEREFVVFGTGHPISDDLKDRLKYIGTTMTGNGSFVWHVFEYLKVKH